ncbi:hybrid sensor histidine kinase/response regulator [Burkholderiaceae bacterium DAT-1]|nr:hybrid sensor histidine kinase/response regulator [Burkholderiaceae bacterium DAT-1]
MSEVDSWLLDDADENGLADTPAAQARWKIAIIDDEPDVHLMTRLALKEANYQGRGVELLSAYSGEEGFQLLRNHPDTALVLLDVVMESDDAGLKLVDRIRNELGNRRVRIVLRTGQPGQAPERMVINRYDINDYKCKTELTSERLYTTVIASLRLFDLLHEIESKSDQLATIMQLSSSGVAYFDPERNLAYCNASMLMLFERRMSDVQDMPLMEVLNLLVSRGARLERTHQLLNAGQLLNQAEASPEGIILEVCHPVSAVFSIKAKATPDGGLALYMRDMTRENQVERMKSEFLSMAAHELRTPMASIRGFSELLLHMEIDPSQMRDMLETINRQSVRLTHLLNDLLDLAKIEAGGANVLKPEVCSIDTFIQPAIDASFTPDKRPRLVMQHAARSAQVRVDIGKMQQVMLNLLGNAIKYSSEGSAIELSTRALGEDEGGGVNIVVRDHGIGMKPEHVARAFERFFRADESGHIPGTGLGLSIAKEIVDLLGGHVTLSSEFGKGTTVTVCLPAVSNG